MYLVHWMISLYAYICFMIYRIFFESWKWYLIYFWFLNWNCQTSGMLELWYFQLHFWGPWHGGSCRAKVQFFPIKWKGVFFDTKCYKMYTFTRLLTVTPIFMFWVWKNSDKYLTLVSNFENFCGALKHNRAWVITMQTGALHETQQM
jgi:hypothetical protein